jgi:hypothetical protein
MLVIYWCYIGVMIIDEDNDVVLMMWYVDDVMMW